MVSDEFDRAIALGQRNARIVQAAQDHCQHMSFVIRGGVGLAEQMTGLPIAMRSVECPKARGNSIAGNVWHVARDFYIDNCVGCEMRRPTGSLPTLATLVLEEEQAASEQAEAQARREATALQKRGARAERRRALRAAAGPAMLKALDDLELVDNPSADDRDDVRPGATDSRKAALRRLSALADKAPHTFSADVIDALVDTATATASLALLDPLRTLARSDPTLATRLTSIAFDALERSPSREAARVVVQFADRVSAAALTEKIVYHLVATAYGPQSGTIGHWAANKASDPAVLDYLASAVPKLLVQTLSDMLPGTEASSPLVLPPGTSRASRADDEFDRATAADAISYLIPAGFPLVQELIPAIIRNLLVAGDAYDTYPHGAVSRAAALYVLHRVNGAEVALDAAGASASDEHRSELFKVWWQLSRLVNRDGYGWGAGSPRLSVEESKDLQDRIFAALMTFIDGRWGYEVSSEAATTISTLTTDDPAWAATKLDALLGGFTTAYAAVYREQSSLLDTSQTSTSVLAPLEATSQRMAYLASAGRFLDAIETVATIDPTASLDGLLNLISHERDTSDEDRVVWRLLPVIGSIARDRGAYPGVLARVVPLLYTHLVSADPTLIARAVEAWADARARHPLPSLFEDLLPTLMSDRRIVVIDAILRAAPRLHLPSHAQSRCLSYALRMSAAAADDGRLDIVKLAILCATRLSRDHPEYTLGTETELLRRAAGLAPRDIDAILRATWSKEAQRTVEYAILRSERLKGALEDDVFHPRQEEEAVALLDTGAGLGGLNAEELLKSALELGPRRVATALTYVEVMWRAGRVVDAHHIAQALLQSLPSTIAFTRERHLIATVVAGASAELTPAGSVDDRTATAGSDMYRRLDEQVAVRAELRKRLRALTEAPLTEVDEMRAVATSLVDNAAQLESTAGGRTPTAAYIRQVAALVRTGARILLAEAAEMADEPSKAHRRAIVRGLDAVLSGLEANFAPDDPLVAELRALTLRVQSVRQTDDDAIREMSEWAGVSMPLVVVEGSPLQPVRHDDDESPATMTPAPVAVALVSIDDGLLTGPAVLRPHTVYKIGVELWVENRPEWASRVEVEFVGALSPQDVNLPVLTIPLDPDYKGVLRGDGTLVLRFSLPAGRPAPPFAVIARWAGMDDDGHPKYQRLDVAGHAQIRIRPFDETRDQLTSVDVIDERLLALYSKLVDTGYPDDELQAFARLFTAVCRSGFRRTWDRRYKRGARVTERMFHDDMYDDLLDDPTLEGRVERGSPLGLGYLDLRHDKITAELKVERYVPVTRTSAPRYMGQATQYAAADGRHMSILAILDMSPKELPIGTPENYLFTLVPAQHGLQGPDAPSVVAVVVVNGNLPVPSTWSRRKSGSTLADYPSPLSED